jgi:hypothetical protein
MKKINASRRMKRGQESKTVPSKPVPSSTYSAVQKRHWRRQQAGEPCPRSCQICKRLAKAAGQRTAAQTQVSAPVSADMSAPMSAGMSADQQTRRQALAVMPMQTFLAQLREAQTVAPHARPAAALSADHSGNHPAVLLVLLLLCAGAAIAGFVMAWDSLTGSYHGISAPARALAVFAAELVFGHFAYVAYRARGWLAAAPCGVVVLLCAFVDIGIAGMQGAVAERQAKDAIISAPSTAMQLQTKCEPRQAPADYGTQRLPIWQEGEEKRMAACLAAQAQERQQLQTQAEKAQASRIKLAGDKTFFEVLMPGLMPLLGALAAAAVMPLFEMLVASLRRRPGAQIVGGKAGAS